MYSVLQWIQCLAAICLCVFFLRKVKRGLWVAWTHPMCAKCGFDLRGSPPTSDRCPECGEELAKVRRTGVRRRRWISLGLSLILIVMTLGVIGHELIQPWVIVKLPNFVLLQVEPLLYGWNSSWNPESRFERELNFRLYTGRLSDEQVTKVAQIAFHELATAAAGDPSRAAWIIYAHDHGNLSPQMWKQFARASLSISVKPKASIGPDEAVKVGIYFKSSSLFNRILLPHFAIDNKPLGAPYPPGEIVFPPRLGMYQTLAVLIPPETVAKLGTGTHTLRMTFDAQVIDATTGEKLVSSTVAMQQPIFILAQGPSTVTQVPFASLSRFMGDARQVREVFRMESIDRKEGKPRFVDRFHLEGFVYGPYQGGYFSASYKVIARSQGKEILLGIYTGVQPFWTPAETKPNLTTPTVDIILRPDPQSAAQRANDINTIYSDVIEYKDVPVN